MNRALHQPDTAGSSGISKTKVVMEAWGRKKGSGGKQRIKMQFIFADSSMNRWLLRQMAQFMNEKVSSNNIVDVTDLTACKANTGVDGGHLRQKTTQPGLALKTCYWELSWVLRSQKLCFENEEFGVENWPCCLRHKLQICLT